MSQEIGVTFSIKDDFSSTVDGIKDKVKGIKPPIDDTAKSVSKFGDAGKSGFGKFASGMGQIAGAIGITKAVSAGINLITGSIGGAITRFDTMENSQKVFENLGFEGDAVTRTMDNLTDSLDGLPTASNDAIQNIQRISMANDDIEAAGKMFESLNYAVLATGKGQEEVNATTEVLSRAMQKGSIDGMEWQTLMNNMGPTLKNMADKMGISTEKLQKGLSDGTISMKDFEKGLHDLAENGNGDFADLETQARDLTSGIGTAMTNFKSRVQGGIQNGLIKPFEDALANKGLPGIADVINTVSSKIRDTLVGIGEHIPGVIDVIMGMYERIKPGLEWISQTGFPMMKDAIGGMYESIQPGLNWIAEEGFPLMKDAIKEAFDMGVQMYDFINENWNLIEPIVAGVTGAFVAYKGIMVLSELWTGLMAIKAVVLTAAQGGLAGAQATLNAVMAANPIGLVALAIGILIGVGVALYKNWDTVKEKTIELWNQFKETKVFDLLAIAFEHVSGPVSTLIGYFKTAYKWFGNLKESFANFKVPDWVSKLGGISVGGVMDKGKKLLGFASGTNKVPQDMTANIHKGEMVIPARQSANLRKQGTNIHNIDKGGGGSPKVVSGGGVTITGNTFNVREESDIDKIATVLFNKLSGASLNMA